MFYVGCKWSCLDSYGAGRDPGRLSGGEADLMAAPVVNEIWDCRVHTCCW